MCQSCRLKLDYKEGIRKKPRESVHTLNTLKESRLRKREKPTFQSAGYVRIWTSDINHPRINLNKRDIQPSGGRVYEHILVMEKHLGRYLSESEQVHHLNGAKNDNKIENLHLVQDGVHHQQIHRKLEQFIYSLITSGIVKFEKETETFSLDVSVV